MQEQALARWSKIADDVAESLEGRADVDVARGKEGLSPRETAHHILEANLVAATIVIAAIGKPGTAYDWTWLWPDKAWCHRLGYDRAPIGPALDTLRALSVQLTNLLTADPRRGACEVVLRDTPDGKPYRKTVLEVLADEVKHAEHHLGDLGPRQSAR
jgi:hypothetical protein